MLARTFIVASCAALAAAVPTQMPADLAQQALGALSHLGSEDVHTSTVWTFSDCGKRAMRSRGL
jgi:hypothetical protein